MNEFSKEKFMAYLLLIVGMVLLIKGADFFVDGSASIAKALKVPSVIIGLTIVALGTSLPEASVSITAGLAGNNALALSNVVGSNIFNTLVVVGCSALIAPFLMDSQILKRDLPINILVSVLLVIFVLDGNLSRIEGIIFLVCLGVYIFSLIKAALKSRQDEVQEKALSVPVSLVCIVVGVVAIIWGGNLVVNNATVIAQQLGWSDTLIGLTIVSIGTSLPELVTSIVAAKKGESGLSLGNAIGSNIMNVLFILGASATLHPIAATIENIVDAIILIGVAIYMLIIAKKSEKMTRSKACLSIGLYVAYMIYILIR